MSYLGDDVVVTKDGKEHRVLWQCKTGEVLFVKPVGRHAKAYKVKVCNVIEHRRKGEKC